MRLHSKGYLMAEILIVMVIMMIVSILYLPRDIAFDLSDYRFISEYHLAHTLSLLEERVVNLEDLHHMNYRYPIYFSKEGNVNMAQTILGHKHQMVIHLGSGYLTYEK